MRFLALSFFAASALAAADLTGAWACQVETDAGSGTPSFELKQDAAALSGKYSGTLGQADVTGKVDGDAFELGFKVEIGAINYKGKLADGVLKGKVDIAGQATGTFTCKRK